MLVGTTSESAGDGPEAAGSAEALDSGRPQSRASDAPGNGSAGVEIQQVDDRRRQVAETHRLGDNPRPGLPVPAPLPLSAGGTITSGTWS